MSDSAPLTTPEAFSRALPARGFVSVGGALGGGVALLGRALAGSRRGPLVVIAPDAEGANTLAADLGYFLGEDVPRVMPPPAANPYLDVRPDVRAAMLRLAALAALARGETPVVVATADVLCRRLVPSDVLRRVSVELGVGDTVDIQTLSVSLARAGYLRVPIVEDSGTFAVRGGLLDVWPGGDAEALRVELDGDTVARMRRFDGASQRTRSDVAHAVVAPARENLVLDGEAPGVVARMRALCDAVNTPSSKARLLCDDVAEGRLVYGGEALLPVLFELAPLWDVVPDGSTVLIEDPPRVLARVREQVEVLRAGYAGRSGAPRVRPELLLLDEADAWGGLSRQRVVLAHRTLTVSASAPQTLDVLEHVASGAPTLAFRAQDELALASKQARGAHGKSGTLDPLLGKLSEWEDDGLRVTIVARAATQADRIRTLLEHRGLTPSEVTAEKSSTDAVSIAIGGLERGVIAPVLGRVWLTEEEIFGHRAHRQRPRERPARALFEDLRALTVGDYIVHVDHGIGRYAGLERRRVSADGEVDLLVVEYAGGDRLFLPVYRLNQIQKFSGGDAKPRVDRLGGVSFEKTKRRAKKRARDMADALLALYAERENAERKILTPPDDDLAAFEAGFPFEETPDQAAAIADVMSDLTRSRVMDRLICGDVGFGKTEVALRAAFRHAMSGYQVALLAPTTVLAQQHFMTCERRFAETALTTRVLSRFQSRADQSETLELARSGRVDIIVGTHRLLSRDVHFKNLGLLIVDEEQRFGVTHKERIKQLRKDVDVLTLTATPIPRTLQLAAGGLRDMSIIRTAPSDRRAIRTITSHHDEGIIKEAIERELSRGGQVFYVYNRVEGIYERANRVQALVPHARVAVGHGQLKEAALEKVMLGFVRGDTDVLVATSIIESGLDIPRANTMIVDRADRFGLAQLYQLRGRVGRARERAYCYLLVPPPSELSDEARARIEALERYTELGSGFHIASLDMELRGAGDLLGAEQSGTIASVGVEMFCHLLEEAASELRGHVVVHDVEPELSFDVDGLLPETFISEVGLRLSFYKRLASAVHAEEVDELANEIEDRFGTPPSPARRLFELMRLKTELRQLKVLTCEASARRVTLRLRDDTPLDGARVVPFVADRAGYRLLPDNRVVRQAAVGEVFSSGIALAGRMLGELGELTDV